MRLSVAWPHEVRLGSLAGLARSLVFLVLASLCQAAPASPAGAPTSVWIDTDAACGQAATADADDCWALLLALSSPELTIHGISTVFGNVDEETVFAVTRTVLDQWAESGGEDLPPVHRGSQQAGGGAARPAIAAIATALDQGQLTILALGPLTNVAALLAQHPQVADNIQQIVAVGGTRPSQRRLFPGTSGLLHFHDFNFTQDPAAFEAILSSGVALSLLPFEAAQRVTVTPTDLSLLSSSGGVAQWLAVMSRGWMRFWLEHLGTEGFYPFDSLAVGYVIDRQDFVCEPIPARVQKQRSLLFARDALEVSHNLEQSTSVTYCSDVNPSFGRELVARMVDLGRDW